MNARIRPWVACAVVASLLGFSTSARAVIIAQGEGLGTTSGWDGVGYILKSVNGGTPSIVGTAALVDYQHLITAAHVFDTTNPTNTTFTLKLGSDSYAVTPVVNPNYVGNEDYDIAVGVLATLATGHTTYAWNNSLIANEKAVGAMTLVGFGYGGSATAGQMPATYPMGTKREGQNTIDLVTTAGTTHVVDSAGRSADLPAGLIVFDFDDGTTAKNSLASFGSSATPILNFEGDSTDGDSGGPMFQSDGSRWVITGIITSGTDPLMRYGDVAWGTRVGAYTSFVSANVPEPGTVGAVLAGLLVLAQSRRRGK